MNLRIVIADDQNLMRSGLRAILDTASDLEVVGEASDGREAVAVVRELRPAVVLMDIRMPGLDGIEATRRITAEPRSATKVLILTTYDLDQHLYDAVRAGASGFLLKTAPPGQLIEAVRAVAAGDTLLAPTMTRRLLEDFASRRRPGAGIPDELRPLTERELDVLRLVARGMSNGEIASRLYLGEATVKTHVTRVLRKLDLRDRIQAVVLAYESGLTQPGGDHAEGS